MAKAWGSGVGMARVWWRSSSDDLAKTMLVVVDLTVESSSNQCLFTVDISHSGG